MPSVVGLNFFLFDFGLFDAFFGLGKGSLDELRNVELVELELRVECWEDARVNVIDDILRESKG